MAALPPAPPLPKPPAPPAPPAPRALPTALRASSVVRAISLSVAAAATTPVQVALVRPTGRVHWLVTVDPGGSLKWSDTAGHAVPVDLSVAASTTTHLSGSMTWTAPASSPASTTGGG